MSDADPRYQGLPDPACIDAHSGCMFTVVESDRVMVDGARCIRCGACSTLAPDIFTLRDGPATLLRQPASEHEQDRCAAALLICPSQAIGSRKANA